MDEQARRRELKAEYREAAIEAGVYRIHNRAKQRSLIGTATNLAGMRNRFEFGKSMGMASTVDGRLTRDLKADGWDAFEFEVLETVTPSGSTTSEQLRQELDTLEALWREKLGEEALY